LMGGVEVLVQCGLGKVGRQTSMAPIHRETPQGPLDERGVDLIAEGFVQIEGVDMYRIADSDAMPPFLMSVVSDSDHWMYVSTRGGLAAGRVEPERSLFPYETDDRLYRAAGSTGPFTLLRVSQDGGEPVLWEPFTNRAAVTPAARNLYKSLAGDTVVFEEIRDDLGLIFRYRWNTSALYGFVRTSTLVPNHPSRPLRVEILDGLLNIMPANVPLSLQQSSSTLAEAYRRNEVDPATGMAIYSLESRITDRAEPAESLHANIAWSIGLHDSKVVLSGDQISDFRKGHDLESERLTKGTRGHYLLNATIDLDGDISKSWWIVADVYQSQLAVQHRRSQLLHESNLLDGIVDDITLGSDRLRSLIDTSDGNQCTADPMATAHHFANTLFNCMRGGVFVDSGSVSIEDLLRFIENRNRVVLRVHAPWLSALGERVAHEELLTQAADRNDPDLERLCLEYLPLTFSRRHGDPSRPWNTFSIKMRNDDGSQTLDYQGNWRDIFQNWEALCYSFPDYLESVVAKFVNASTVDGFNPYRVTRGGIDWEIPDPNDPWSNTGYWGDHQIIYLLRLLEGFVAFHPEALPRLLSREIFSYADVPYRLRPYDSILRDSKNTIEFDHVRAREIDDRSAIIGSDGRLVLGTDGNVVHVTMAEKLVVPALTKLANLVLDGGIWMNTQRPEWNDANNALVGNGVSMVTLSYLRRYLSFCLGLFDASSETEFVLTVEVAEWLNNTLTILSAYADRLEQPRVTDRHRKRLLDALGTAFSDYRATAQANGFSGRATVPVQTFVDLCRIGRDYADHTIHANRQESGLYHSYNLLHLEDEGHEIRVDHLPEMLEGQVAVLSSGVLSSDEVLTVVDALFASPLYRRDQHSFVLYPARELPSFLERNAIPDAEAETDALVLALVDAGDTTIFERDEFGIYRFAPSLISEANLVAALDRLSADPAWGDLVALHRSHVYELFEGVFQHKRFTGRSGSMYKYEGLGSIYWHMVSKLLLAVQEAFWKAVAGDEPRARLEALADAYYRVRAGLSSDKTPQEYGAFPMDPYSHTPGHMGAQQPGMTGQVKEEILSRWGELGLRVTNGTLSFDSRLLRSQEFFKEERAWLFHDVTGTEQTILLPPESLGFTYCQVPVVYKLGENGAAIALHTVDGHTTHIVGTSLDEQVSQAVFSRSGTVTVIEVTVPRSAPRRT
jgi:hypothetical protein